MTRTEILCPECKNKKLLTSNQQDAHCDECGTEFTMVGPTTVRYKPAGGFLERDQTRYGIPVITDKFLK